MGQARTQAASHCPARSSSPSLTAATWCAHLSCPAQTGLPCRLLHEPPNTLELRLLEAECADLKFKLQTAEERAAGERQAAAAAQQAAEAARREAGERSEALAVALGRWAGWALGWRGKQCEADVAVAQVSTRERMPCAGAPCSWASTGCSNSIPERAPSGAAIRPSRSAGWRRCWFSKTRLPPSLQPAKLTAPACRPLCPVGYEAEGKGEERAGSGIARLCLKWPGANCIGRVLPGASEHCCPAQPPGTLPQTLTSQVQS